MLRNYAEAPRNVREHYKNQHSLLTPSIARTYVEHEDRLDTAAVMATADEILGLETPVLELLNVCAETTDLSDPDFGRGQHLHAFQAAKAAQRCVEREGCPSWFPCLALLHDLGKARNIMRGWPLWSLVGDSYPLNAPIEAAALPFGSEHMSNGVFPDIRVVPALECGFESMLWAGHDEVIYRALRRSSTSIPHVALYIARFHSFYAWHRHNSYSDYANMRDIEMLDLLCKFSECDLYSKDDAVCEEEPSLEAEFNEFMHEHGDILHSWLPRTGVLI